MLTEILFSEDDFPKGKTLHAIVLPENEDYYHFIKEQKEHGLKTIVLSSNALLSILCHYFAEKHAEIFEVKLFDPLPKRNGYGELNQYWSQYFIDQSCVLMHNNRDNVVYLLECIDQALQKGNEIKKIALKTDKGTFIVNMSGTIKTNAEKDDIAQFSKNIEKILKNELL